MKTFVFREELEQASLKWQLRRLMEIHRVVNLDLLSLESGLPENVVRSLLEDMVIRGEVIRLRPLAYNKDDLDFFRLYHLPRVSHGAFGHSRRHRWHRWIEQARRAVRAPILGRKQHAYT